MVCVLEAYENPSADITQRAIEMFGTPEKAYDAFSIQWRRTRERLPVYGVAGVLKSLEKSLAIPKEKSILNKPLPPTMGPEDFFRQR